MKAITRVMATLLITGLALSQSVRADGEGGLLPFCDTACQLAAAQSIEARHCVLQRFGSRYAAALEDCRQAARQGDATAQTLLGEMLFLGLGTPQDLQGAFFWYRRAADQAQPHAQAMVAEMTRLKLGPQAEEMLASRNF